MQSIHCSPSFFHSGWIHADDANRSHHPTLFASCVILIAVILLGLIIALAQVSQSPDLACCQLCQPVWLLSLCYLCSSNTWPWTADIVVGLLTLQGEWSLESVQDTHKPINLHGCSSWIPSLPLCLLPWSTQSWWHCLSDTASFITATTLMSRSRNFLKRNSNEVNLASGQPKNLTQFARHIHQGVCGKCECTDSCDFGMPCNLKQIARKFVWLVQLRWG